MERKVNKTDKEKTHSQKDEQKDWQMRWSRTLKKKKKEKKEFDDKNPTKAATSL